MSDLRIRFGDDMPTATVEVISPDLDVVDRVMLSAGRSRVVEVPSEASFLRVYLPSGQVVTLDDPGNLDREITLRGIRSRSRQGDSTSKAGPGFSAPALDEVSPEEVEPEEVTTLAHVRRYHKVRSTREPSLGLLQNAVPLGSYGVARLVLPNGSILSGGTVGRGREAHWDITRPLQDPPLRLTIEQTSGERLELQLPADVRRVWARADMVRDQSSLTLSIRASTQDPTADTAIGYLHRGDLNSAAATAAWIEDAGDMLREKMENPYAACVGAYLLLRLRRFQEMRDWARNLADRFPFISDGCVIWATQLQYQRTGNTGEIRRYFLRAAERGLPVYSEGLRLLTDGLRLLGDDGASAREELLANAGAVLWTSPFTASIHASPTYSRESSAMSITYDIALAAKA